MSARSLGADAVTLYKITRFREFGFGKNTNGSNVNDFFVFYVGRYSLQKFWTHARLGKVGTVYLGTLFVLGGSGIRTLDI